jgi:hypothetical protein
MEVFPIASRTFIAELPKGGLRVELRVSGRSSLIGNTHTAVHRFTQIYRIITDDSRSFSDIVGLARSETVFVNSTPVEVELMVLDWCAFQKKSVWNSPDWRSRDMAGNRR